MPAKQLMAKNKTWRHLFQNLRALLPSMKKQQKVQDSASKKTSPVTALRNTAQPLSSHLPCTDMLDLNGSVEDDSDDELPTFDVCSSLGIEPV